MVKVELDEDLWMKIIGYLRRPLPRPTGNNPRSSIRQPYLAACMLVSKHFNIMTAPILYKIVATDNPSSLVYGHNHFPAPGSLLRFRNVNLPPLEIVKDIPSKIECLGYVERLYLEYSSKDAPSYEELLRHGAHDYDRVGMDDAALREVCARECDEIADSTLVLYNYTKKKYTFSTGAFLPGQADIWERLHIGEDGQQSQSTVMGRANVLKLAFQPHPTYFCHRVTLGPLSFSSLPVVAQHCPPPSHRGPTYPAGRAHIHEVSRGGHIPHMIAGGHSRWYLALGKTPSEVEIRAAFSGSHELIEHFSMLRADAVNAWQARGVDPKIFTDQSSVHVDVYLPPPLTFSPDQAEKTKQILLMIKDRGYALSSSGIVPPETFEKDVWNMKKMSLAPRCEACDWCIDDL